MEAVQENKVVQFTEGWKQPENLRSIRKEAKQALNAMDFPTTRVEDWKYTRTTRITNKTFTQQDAQVEVDEFKIDNLKCHELVFVNGFFDEQSSTLLEDAGLSIKGIETLDEEAYAELLEDTEENVFSLINKAYSTGGLYIHQEKNKKANYPVHIIHVTTGNSVIANVRHFVEVEQGAELYVITSYNSKNAIDCFNNVVFEGLVGENASLTIDKLQTEEQTVFNISKENFIQDPSSRFLMNTITTGGLLVRNGVNILVEGANCYSEINGVYLGRGKQHLDNHTFIDHLYEHCTSSETYKGVMDDSSTGVFNGKVIVRQDAQKIEAYQSNGNILLSDKSSVNSKPELEIYADDVRCSHGSTTGQLDEDALFYLQARGINKKSAQKLLVAAFIGEVLDKIKNEDTRAHVDKLFLDQFGWEF
jgi:Fe-S cluster assembly protein SufD